jgi:predicted transcriptional regulator of viral defense system
MDINDFFLRHSVFSLEEVDDFLASRGSGNIRTRNSLLYYYRSHGRLLSIRRGLYAVMPPDSGPIDPYLIAAKIAKDAVIAYHTALEFHGKSYSTWKRFYYLAQRQYAPLKFQSYEFRSVAIPQSLRDKGTQFGIDELDRSGVAVRITNLERTFVDIMDRPNLAGSWEEIWRSLESIEYFDLEKVIKYVNLLKNATTAAKVGFYLEQHREALMVDEKHIKLLQQFRPRQPHYLERSRRKTGRLILNWNLVVPQEIIDRSWAEVL